MSSNSVDFIDQILNGLNVMLAQRFLNNSVIRKRDSLSIDLSISSLENKLSDNIS